MKPVSATTEQALSEAMARLFDGCPRVTDGRLTVVNLAVEAGVSRATANRALKVLAVFREALIEARSRRDAEDQPMAASRAEQERRAVNNILAQHHQVRALCELMEQRRYRYNAEVIPIANRKRP